MSRFNLALLGAATTLTTATLALTWVGVTRDPWAVGLAAAAALALGALGIVLRSLISSRVPVALLQLLALGGIVAWQAWPLGSVTKAWDAASAAVLTSGGRDAPLPAGLGSTLVVVVAVGLLAWAADALAATWRRPLAAVVPLAMLLLVPAHTSTNRGLWGAGTTALGIGLAWMLFAAHRQPTLARRRWAGWARRWAVVSVVTAAAVALTLVVAPRVAPPAARRASDPIQMTDVSLELKRNIAQGKKSPAFTYRTKDGEGAYLRLYSLTMFDDHGWQLTNSDVRFGGLPRPSELRRGTPRTTDVTITGFASEWLPAPYSPTSTTAGDDWGYLPGTRSILALSGASRETATAGLRYTVESLEAQPSAEEIAAAETAAPAEAPESMTVPSDLTPRLRDLAQTITKDSPAPGAKAQAILDYLKQPGFTYSLQAQPGSGYASLETFLFEDRRGFCVQYAASMAILARASGIPSRVAIGFTPGSKSADGYQVTMRDMHAWPELYFADWGWVSFEPTPGIGGNPLQPGDAPTPTATRTPTATPTRGASSAGTAPSASTSPTAAPSAQPARPIGVPGWLLPAALLALLVAAATLPRVLRARGRARRLGAHDDGRAAALAAWQELTATASDYGLATPSGSPRFAAPGLAAAVGLADDALRDLATATEQALYAPPAQGPQARDWGATVARFAHAAQERATRAERLRAAWWPASLFQR